MIAYAKLPFEFDYLSTRQELEEFKAEWQPHFNQSNYQGEWNGIALRSPGGKENILPDLQTETEFANTSYLTCFPSVSRFLNSLNCPLQSVRFLNLKAGAVIKPHRDFNLEFEQGEARLHFPIITNDLVQFVVDDTEIKMKSGDCWYINVNLKHHVTNRGTTDRIHLVIDCKVNDWLKDIFNNSIKKEYQAGVNIAEKLEIIKSLRLQNNETARQLADQMERELS